MSVQIDEAHQRFTKIQDELQRALDKPLNEADTRFKVLDRVLLEVLGWSHDRVSTEAGVIDGFVDYTLHDLDGRPAMVIEAKRVGRLSVGTAAGKVAGLVLSGSVLKNLGAAIRQALGYASLKSVPIACVTDGRCWLFFQTNRRDGTPVIDGKGIFFPNLASVAAEFPKFHDLLSESGLRDRLGLVQLNRVEGLRSTQDEDQITVSPPREAKLLPRDALSQDASLLFSQFFSNISVDSDDEMLRKCFVTTPESRKADLELEKIAQKLLNGIESIDTDSSIALQSEVERAVSAMRSETVLIVGNKGSGKTTFLARFFADVMPDALRRQCVVINIPLDRFPEVDKSRLPAWALRQLRDQLEKELCSGEQPTFDELRGTFWKEYQRLRGGTLAPLYEKDRVEFRVQFGRSLEQLRESAPEVYVQAFLERAVRSDRRLPCIIFDNADQFSPAIQDAIFQMAHAISVSTPVLNIVPITDRTVWRLSKVGALQSYASRSFFLPVPEAKQILQKRIEYIKDKLNDDEELSKRYFSSRGFRVTLQNIDRFARAVERLFVDNDFVSGLIGRLSNFDIRRMLQLAERIFLSPEIKVDDVLKSSFGFAPGRSELLRIHRAIIKGEYDRYSDNANDFVYNLFWTDPAYPSSPLLAYYILWTLRARLSSSRNESVDSRHWTAGELATFFEPAGVDPEQTLTILQRLRDRVLIETLDPNVERLSLGQRVAITESGIAHLELTLQSAVYVEQMAMATGLNSRSIYNQIRDLRNAATADSFTAIKRVFADYLIEVDSVRVKIPSAREYAGLIEAKKFIRGLGTTVPVQHGAASGHSFKGRSAPAPSVGGVIRGRRDR